MKLVKLIVVWTPRIIISENCFIISYIYIFHAYMNDSKGQFFKLLGIIISKLEH